MSEKKQTKEIKIKLNYYKSKSDKENGVYFGGVVEPKYTNELKISIADDYKFDIAIKFTLMKNSGEMRIMEYVREKRTLISEALEIAYYKAIKLLKIKNDGDDI